MYDKDGGFTVVPCQRYSNESCGAKVIVTQQWLDYNRVLLIMCYLSCYYVRLLLKYMYNCNNISIEKYIFYFVNVK